VRNFLAASSSSRLKARPPLFETCSYIILLSADGRDTGRYSEKISLRSLRDAFNLVSNDVAFVLPRYPVLMAFMEFTNDADENVRHMKMAYERSIVQRCPAVNVLMIHFCCGDVEKYFFHRIELERTESLHVVTFCYR